MKSLLPFKICLVFVMGFFAFVQAQQPKIPLLINTENHEECGFNSRHRNLLQTDADYAAKRQQEEAHIDNFMRNPLVEKAVKTIPIVVHVIHTGQSVGTGANISDAQIQSAIDNMNDAYRNMAPYTGVDTEIEFCLAQRDPNGNPSTGIVRVSGTGVTNYSTQGIISSNEQAVKNLSKWDNTRYYNFWIVTEIDNNGGGSGTQGYAYFPGAGPAVDGAVMLYNAFGYDPTGVLGYNLKSYTNMNVTAVHEMGHALNLYHTFEGDDGGAQCPTGNLCGSDLGDCCADTPPHRNSNSGCVSDATANACQAGTTAGDYQHNFMDYSSDDCQTEFTANQTTRMNATLTGGGLRASLTSSDGCNPVNNPRDASITSIVAPVSSYCQTTFSPQVTLRNFGTNTLTSVTITYNVDGGTSQVYNWTGSLLTGASEIVTLDPVTAAVGAHTFFASTSLPNGGADQYAANDASSVSFTITTSSSLPFVQDFEGAFPPAGWSNLSNDGTDGTGWDVDGTKQLEKRAVAVQSSGTAGNAMAINGYAYQSSTGNRYDEMTSPSIDMSSAGSPQLTFQVSHAYYNITPNYEGLKVYISTDCGVNYTVIYDKSAAALATAGQNSNPWAPTAVGHWRQETIDLSAYAGDVVKFKFETFSNYGNNLYIDKINVADNCATPVITTNPTNVTRCSGANASFTAANTNGGTYRWQEDAGGGFVNINDGGIYSGATTNTLNLTGVTTGLNGYKYRAVVTNGCGFANSGQATLTVNAIPATPTITADGATTFCSGGDVVLTSSSATGNTWSTGAVTQSITVINTVAVTVTATVNGCTSGSSLTTNVTVNPTPSVNIASQSNPTACSATDGSIQVGGSGTGDLSWTGTASGMMSGVTLPATVSGLGAGTYSFTLTNACTSNTVSATLTEPGAPATPTITAGGSTTICQGDAVTLTSSSSANNTWSTGETTQSISVSTAGSYFVTVTQSGCSSTSASTVVTVNPVPSAPTITPVGPTTFCDGGSVTLMSSSLTNNVWSTGETTQSITVSSGNTIILTVVESGCSSAAASEIVTVNSLPATPTITPSAFTTICIGETIDLVSSSSTGNTWSTGETTQTITVATGGDYNVTVSNGSCSATSSDITITVNTSAPATPTVSAGGPVTFCEGGSVTLTSSETAGNTWSTGETTQSITVDQSGVYTVSIGSGNCTATSAATTVTENPVPAVTLSAFNDICNTGAAFTLTGGSPAGGTYTVDGTTATDFDPADAGSGTFTIDYTFTDNNSCSASATQTITVNDCSGIAESAMSMFLVYPNPASSSVVISGDKIAQVKSVVLYDATGREVLIVTNPEAGKPVELNAYSNGVYTLVLAGDNFSEKVKIHILK
ncbi:MAG: hypothetical protein K0R65_1658 [Crocinitomicaceae bacterium]|jgi:hypothetical protein|nr:hypothetical protein [Crocinitomicaceae bacterium]